MPPELVLDRPEALVNFLPDRMPRFKAGDRPARAGEWELVELLRIGGFGEVWKGFNARLGETSAFKFCLDEQAAATLRNEASLLRRIRGEGQHPGIVPLQDTNLSADPPYLRYEHVAGDFAGLVQEWASDGGPERAARARRIIRRLAETVGHMHGQAPPIVHRDLKPTNILICRAGGDDQALIADFGIGDVASGQALREEQTRGATGRLATALRGACTPLYASPEQAADRPTRATTCTHWA